MIEVAIVSIAREVNSTHAHTHRNSEEEDIVSPSLSQSLRFPHPVPP